MRVIVLCNTACIASSAGAGISTTGFACAERRRGVRISDGVKVQRLQLQSGKVAGVDTPQGRFDAPIVVSLQNIWALTSNSGPAWPLR